MHHVDDLVLTSESATRDQRLHLVACTARSKRA